MVTIRHLPARLPSPLGVVRIDLGPFNIGVAGRWGIMRRGACVMVSSLGHNLLEHHGVVISYH